MATAFMNFDTKHAVAGSSKLKATKEGHIYNVKVTASMDNGTIITKGDYLGKEVYKDAAGSATFKAKVIDFAGNGNALVEVEAVAGDLLVLNVPMIYEEYTTECQNESNFFNAAGDIVRAYELYVGDVFELSKEGFAVAPVKGTEYKVTSGKLAVVA